MDFETVKPLQNAYLRKLNATNCKFRRYLHKKINWDARLIGIKGARGVGKTTLMLQHIKDRWTTCGSTNIRLKNLWNVFTIKVLKQFSWTKSIN